MDAADEARGGGGPLCKPSVGWDAQVLLPRRPACWTFRRLKMLVPARNTTSCTGNLGSQSPGPCALPMKGVRNLSIFPWVRLASLWESTNHQAGVGDSAVFSASRSPDGRMLDVRLPTTGHLIDGQGGACISRTVARACFGLACLPSLQVLHASLGPKGVDEADALPSAGREILRFLAAWRGTGNLPRRRNGREGSPDGSSCGVGLPGPVRHGSSVYVSFR